MQRCEPLQFLSPGRQQMDLDSPSVRLAGFCGGSLTATVCPPVARSLQFVVLVGIVSRSDPIDRLKVHCDEEEERESLLELPERRARACGGGLPNPRRRMRDTFHAWGRALWPARMAVSGRERGRAIAGAGIGILFTALVCRWWAGTEAAVWLVAPVGASAVLAFALPASPLAQPWSIVGGNTLSALLGVLCAMLIGEPVLAAALAVSLAVAMMFSLRCLHPPGGAAALLAALSGAQLTFVVFPMMANCVLLVLAAIAYNHLTGRRYPHVQTPSAAAATKSGETPRFSERDLDAALAHYDRVLDISRDDLEELLHHAEAASYERRFGDLRCQDIMSHEPVAVQFGTSLADAWALMRTSGIKALPVTDRARRLVGIVTMADFLLVADLRQYEGLGKRLRALMQGSGVVHSEQPEVVGQIMTRQVRVLSARRYLSELIPLFTDAGHHHIPIIDDERRLVGMITQSDVVRALHAVAGPTPPPSPSLEPAVDPKH